MQQFLGVNFAQAVQQMREQAADETFGEFVAVALHMKLQRAPAHVLHDHVNGFIGTEKILHADDIGVRNRRQRATFLKKTFEAVPEHSEVFVGIDFDFCTVDADYQRGRQIFLDRHRDAVFIPCQIDDRKPARGQQLFDCVIVELIPVG